ncbi:TniB family NTP-binding protein [Methylopila turkensis]|uniref:AAA+ ATPase domain-containing protein n=1 Tax=Methylopila turkensis TaxID=1437816 RepID=A0A9W6N8P8_9HYPH|nr:TniB family NTP-binding protein [Methylopila turkensis]GLK81745.1 hypothetical protein GCM10008174_34860 [Methylopila turkensis]
MPKVAEQIAHPEFLALSDRFAQRINAIKGIRIRNDRTLELIQRLHLFKDTASGTGDSAGGALTAPTRAGKTTVIQEFLADFPSIRHGEIDHSPVIYCETPSNANTVSLGAKLLAALGDINPERGTAAAKQRRVVEALRERNTKLLIIDEVQRLVAKDQGKVAHAVADWIQELLNEVSSTCGIILVGTTRARRIFIRNGHLIGRNVPALEMKPYATKNDDSTDWKRYRSYLMTFDTELKRVGGFEISHLHEEDMASRIHAAARGYPGATARLIHITSEAAMRLGDQPTLSRELFAHSFDEMWKFSDAKVVNPFMTPKPPAVEVVWTKDWETSFD